MYITQITWLFIVLTTIITMGFVVIIVCATVSIRKMATQAYQHGAPPHAAESFSSYGMQVAIMATVFSIVVATVLLSLNKTLGQGEIGILSGIAGYVLGSTGKISARSSRQAGRQSTKSDTTSVAEDLVHGK